MGPLSDFSVLNTLGMINYMQFVNMHLKGEFQKQGYIGNR